MNDDIVEEQVEREIPAIPGKSVWKHYYGWQATICVMLSVMAIWTNVLYLGVNDWEILEGPPRGSTLGDPDLAVFVSLALQTDRTVLKQTSGIQTVLTFNTLLPMIVAIVSLQLMPRARASRASLRKSLNWRRAAVWGLDLVVLAIFIVAGATAVRSDAFQTERLAYCFFVFVMNSILLWLANLINRIEKFADPALQAEALFNQQVFMVIHNTVWTMASNMLTHHPGVANADPNDPDVMAWLGGMGFTSLGAETFVFFWLSFVTSQGLKTFFFSPITLFLGIFKPEQKDSASPSKLYGSEELWAPLFLNYAYLAVFSWLNNFSYVIGVGASIIFFLFGLTRKLCYPGYEAPDSYVPYSIPNVLVQVPALTIIFYYVLLLPVDSQYLVMCTENLVLYLMLLAVYLFLYFQDVITGKDVAAVTDTELPVVG